MIRPRPVSSQDWATNYTQDMLSKTTGGPEIQGPYARMGAANACDFDSIRKMQQDGVRTRENGTLHLTVRVLPSWFPCRLFLGPGVRLGACWNRLVETVKTRKKREKTGKKWARYGLKNVNQGS